MQRGSSGRAGTSRPRAARFATNSLREVPAMFGLEAGECNPFPGTGRRAARRTGQLLDATSRVAASYALIAPGCHWSVPALEGIPTEYRFLGGLDAAARLGKTLLFSGVAAAAAWCAAGRDPFRVIEQTLRGRIAAHGGRESHS